MIALAMNDLNKSFIRMEMYKVRYGAKHIDNIAENFVNFANKNGFDPISLAIAWTLHHPAISAPIIGGRSAEQLKASLNAVDIEMSNELREKISNLSNAPETATDRSEETTS